MSALYTHYKFGNDVLEKLSNHQQKTIKKEIKYYNMFNQGFDNLYYYLPKWKYYRNFGINAHKKKVALFFEELVLYIKENKLENDSIITSMLYGIINHYTLDTLIHPYINYQVKNLDIPHTKIEFMLDGRLKDIATYQILIPKLKFNKNLINTIDTLFEHVHNEKNIGKIFNISHNLGYYVYRYFINDKTGIKTAIYRLIDFLIPFKDIKFYQNTFYTKKIDERILNTDKENWHHPNNKNDLYNYSYDQLYEVAINIATKTNKLAYQVLSNKKNCSELIKTIKLIDLKNIPELLKR